MTRELHAHLSNLDPSGNVVYGGGANQATTIDAINVAPNGTPQELQNNYGMSMASWAMTAPTQLISYHEVKFLEARSPVSSGWQSR